MKVYLLKDEDFEELLTALRLDPARVPVLGNANGQLTEEQRRVFDEAHRFYNYHVRTWMEKQKR